MSTLKTLLVICNKLFCNDGLTGFACIEFNDKVTGAKTTLNESSSPWSNVAPSN